ncbi:hypothetical protein [Paenibacillus macerans]|uniref:hypothetical protein n=1 Tax=Paenibacillus macerans TaxID=44252 RepID=UPI00203CC590|nr:hypothetical protein [Paenibacillus macerans]MCM3703134.1 hypothetical protein [Paenibacillus macerans]
MCVQQILKQQEQLEKNVQGLITLFSNQALTLEQFNAQNQRNQEEQFRSFQKKIALFAQLDIDDEQVLKQLLHQVIEKIEVHQDGSIKIHYNIAHPQEMSELLQGA